MVEPMAIAMVFLFLLWLLEELTTRHQRRR